MDSKTYPAQIVFTESDRGHRWVGRLVNRSAIDSQTGKVASPDAMFLICENEETGRCVVTMRGGHRSGTRYANYASVSEAQAAGIRWAGRRFRVVVEG